VQRKVENRPATHPVLQQGSSGAEVEHLQTRLNQDGATPPLVVDGSFGSLTRAAVVAFQGRHGLGADGTVGLRTWGALDELDRRGIAGPAHTVLDDTRPVSQADHDAIEGILNPNVPPGGASPAMTGIGPGGAYETEMLAGLNALAASITGGLSATPAATMTQANSMSDLAQEKVQGVFGSIALASRKPSGEFQPGSSQMGLADASTRPVDEGTILGWTAYFMDNGSRSGHRHRVPPAPRSIVSGPGRHVGAVRHADPRVHAPRGAPDVLQRRRGDRRRRARRAGRGHGRAHDAASVKGDSPDDRR